MSRRNDPTAWMWSEACDLIERAERMHRQFFRLATTAGAQSVWEPPADVYESDDEVVVVVALPGVAARDVEIAAQGGHLVIHARRAPELGGSQHAVRQLEIPYGFFERRIPLPAVPLQAVSEELTHGCLVVRLRKVREA